MNTQACCRCRFFDRATCTMPRMDQESPPTCGEACCCEAGTGAAPNVAIRCHVGSEIVEESICHNANGYTPPTCTGEEPQAEDWLPRQGTACWWNLTHAPGTEPYSFGHCCGTNWTEGGIEYYGSGGGGANYWCLSGWSYDFGGFLPIGLVDPALVLEVGAPDGTLYLACYSSYEWCIPDDLSPAGNPSQAQIPLRGACDPDFFVNCGLNTGTKFGYEGWRYWYAFFDAKPNCDDLRTTWTPLTFKTAVTYLYYRDAESGLLTICRSAIPMIGYYKELEFQFKDAPP
jgi:hypothetical protein